MGLGFEYLAGQTPLDENETEGLLLDTISTQEELNEHEQLNIEEAIEWLRAKTFKPEAVLSEEFIKSLHKRMFSNVWRWAGEYRRTEKNIGIKSYEIVTVVKQLNDDCLYWINHNSYSQDEIAIRYKHRLVSIHCFANGNGRHARLMADVLVHNVLKQAIFSWGKSLRSSKKENVRRQNYLKALKLADKNEYAALLKFSRD